MSHPVIRFENLPVVPGQLARLNGMRGELLQEVGRRTLGDLQSQSAEQLLSETLYSERLRLKRERPNLFTKNRYKGDKKLWREIQSGLLKPAAEVNRKALLQEVVSHYVEEIGGRFDPRVYSFATKAVPWCFSWLLNAASVKRFLPWGMTQSLESRLNILGEVPLLQKLANQGTILLVPTHQSNLDSVLVGYVIYLMSLPPFAYGAGLNLYSNPFLSFFMSNLGAYTVDRQKSNTIYRHALKHYSTRILSEGGHSIFFPGGGRSRSGAIESRLKLGLLGTALDAQIEGIQNGKPNSRVFIVPMVVSYHFVLEASSLIENYLAEAGKHRFIVGSDESFQFSKVLGFFWKMFSSKSTVTTRVGRPLDIFGNFVDDQGQSIGPNGTTIDPAKWLTSGGQVTHEPQRDREYTAQLGRTLTERFHRENTVLSSHLVAFAFFETLRNKYPDFDLFKFLRLTLEQRSFPLSAFLEAAEKFHARICASAARGELTISDELQTSDVRKWVTIGVKQLGLLHEAAVLKINKNVILSEDMNLLYYYRNRLAGYGFSRLAERAGHLDRIGRNDSQGFLE